MKLLNISKPTILWVLLILYVHVSVAKKSTRRRPANGDDNASESVNSDDRQQLFEGIDDPESSAQAISSAAVNPYSTQLLLQNQAGLFNNPGLFGGGTRNINSAAAAAIGSGNIANLGGGLFSNQRYQLPIAGQGLNGNSFVNAAIGGLSGYQNPYQNPYLFGGANIPGIGSPDIFSQSAAAAQLYNNPYLGAAALGGAGASAGINPLLLRGATNLQYPIVGGNNPYLAAQALLSPYSSYNQLNPYNNFPFASRFGIGVGRSSVGNRQNSNTNNDE